MVLKERTEVEREREKLNNWLQLEFISIQHMVLIVKNTVVSINKE